MQEPKGCDSFKWPIAREQALLAAATGKIASGTELPQIPAAAVRIELQPHETATLPMPPERAPKDNASFAGVLRVSKIDKPGLYTVNLSANG